MRAALCVALLLALTPGPGLGRPRDQDPWFRAGKQAVERARTMQTPDSPARNAILFVADGMGPATVTAARILAGQLAGRKGEENVLAFESLPHVALLKVYNTDQQVPDSAGAMTALASGVKTRAGVLGVSERAVRGDHRSVAGSRVPTLFEEAEQRGWATGLVTTTRLTHATPAACYAHAPERRWEDDSALPEPARTDDFPDIARQFAEFAVGDGLDVVLGGGRGQFLPTDRPDPEEPEVTGRRRDGRNLIEEWQRRHPEGVYVWNRKQFEAIDPNAVTRMLGLFDPSHMEYEVERERDRAGEPSLSEMTEKAIRLLARSPRGFLLMVEGGRIDHGHHSGNAYRALTETVEFARAVDVALALTRPDETLVVVTSDHGHTLTLGGYPTRGNPVLGKVVQNEAPGQAAGTALDASGRPFTTLAYANGPGHLAATDTQPEGVKRLPHRSPRFRSEGAISSRPDLTEVDTEDPSYLQEAAVPLVGETHGGQDVAVYAGGPGAALFHGVQEQHYVYHALVAALGWTTPLEDEPAGAASSATPPAGSPSD